MKILVLFALVILAGVISINDAYAFKTINSDSTGGDCSSIGTWNSATKTCTLSNNLTEGIVIGSNGITLDGNGYTINGNNVGTGILVNAKTIIAIININIENFNDGINLDNAVDVKISGNKISNNVGAGIWTSNSKTIKIIENTVENNNYGLVLNSPAEVSKNQISNNVGAGITINGGSLIRENTISNNGLNGIVSKESNEIRNNIIIGNGGDGISLEGSNPIVRDNLISNNKNSGIIVGHFSGGSRIFGNTIKENNDGLIGRAGGYNNNFVNNIRQASGDGGSLSYMLPPVGGNYWSDYSPDCIDADFNNFCDKPYPFDSGTIGIQDNYVWTVASGWLTKFTIPNSITLDAVDSSGTPYTFTASAISEGKSLSVACNPLSGSIFPIGKTDIICTAENGIHSKFTVTVNPLKPIITVNSPSNDPNSTIEGNNPELKIMVTGNIQNKISGKDSIKVTFKDPKGFVVYDTNLKLDAQGYFNNEFDNPLFVKNMRDSGKYYVKFVYDVIMSEFNFNYKSSVYTTPSIPSTDADGDGIPDSLDQCPTQKETVNGYDDLDGCPDNSPNTIQFKLPSYFKNTARSWAVGQITDYEFLQRVQIEINHGTMIIPDVNISGSGNSGASIPSWIKNNAGWWADGSIDDSSFVQGITYLFKEKMLPVKITLEDEPVQNFVLTLNSIPDKTIEEKKTLVFTPTLTEPLTDVLFSLGNNPPTGASIDSKTGKFMWTPTESQGSASYVFDIIVNKGALEDRESVKITVTEPIISPHTNLNEIKIIPAQGSSAPGCEETSQGCYIPKVASVATGGKVIFSNTDTAAHTFTAGTPQDGPSGEFDTSLVIAGSSYEWIPTREGQLDYYCMVHPWMEGTIFVGEGTYIPPQPEDDFDLQVVMGNQVYDLNVVATMNLSINGITAPQNVALEISDPSGTTVISRSFMVDSEGIAFEFKIDENFKTGTYKVVATTTNNGNPVKETTYFKVKSQYNSFKISSVGVTDQQGNPSTLQAGEMGFIKVNLEATKSITTLVTVNLFDSELTSIGIGSIKTALSSGNSEIILSFMIPSDVAIGSADIYVNAFSDWPSNGGIPLTSEVSITENIE